MKIAPPVFSIGWVVALLVLVAVVVLWLSGHALTREDILGLVGALAVARLL